MPGSATRDAGTLPPAEEAGRGNRGRGDAAGPGSPNAGSPPGSAGPEG